MSEVKTMRGKVGTAKPSKAMQRLLAQAQAPNHEEQIKKLNLLLAEKDQELIQAQKRIEALQAFKRVKRLVKAAKHIIRVIIPDSHGEHIDLQARDACLNDVRRICPDEVICLGDHLDCGGTFSSHQRSYTHEMTESYADDCAAANVFFDLLREAAPNAEFHYLEGNHEAHIERWASRNFHSHKDAVMALDRLGPESVLDLKKRWIKYYRSAEFHMGLTVRGTIQLGKCFFTHGIAHSKHASATHAERFGAPVVHGHTHRSQAYIDRTVTSSLTGGFCPGTLAKLQPLYRHTAPTSWTHGYGLQFVNKSTGRFVHLNIPLFEGNSLLPELTGALRGARGV